ncbi:Serine/threonine-protein kinase PrkC [Pirellula sp. SH-Sr6A]|uniref:serine/threonine protein kinase n=1 Tax=Pirellula sp. SH-Sr6A TaxID=1632865 RepID=UPI00078E4B8D|nr:serine/threonine-protein kinase [Pirellula sp. SH-Sr6A]AMV30562.1 Serine/threonine-protein kinase PrkC [Pirellula sp. SH-Sr6A]
MENPSTFHPALPIPIPHGELLRLDDACESFETWLRVAIPTSSVEIASQLSKHLADLLADGTFRSEESFRIRFLQETLPIAWAWQTERGQSIEVAFYANLGSVIPALHAFWEAKDCTEAPLATERSGNTEPLSDSYALSQAQLEDFAIWIEKYRDACHENPTLGASDWIAAQQGLPAVLRDAMDGMASPDRLGKGAGNWSIGEFQIVREIGRGGMGIVFEAIQPSLGRTVALKILWSGSHSNGEAMKRFQREALTVAKLHHTNIVPIFSVGSDGPINYFAMQYIEGTSLDKILHDPDTPIDWECVANWGLQAAEALEHAHRRGIVHRDVKPSNLLLDREQRIWLSDFGLAKQQNDVTLSVAGALLGTPRYMSPEQASASVHAIDHRSDIYSLGATLYELATGHPVFDAQTPHGVIHQILHSQPVPATRYQHQLPKDFSTILMKCLSKDPTSRYASASELASDLRALLDGRPIRAKQPTLVERSQRWIRQHRNEFTWSVTSIVASLMLLAFAILSWVGYRQWRESHLSLTSPATSLTAEILSADGTLALHAQTVPTQDPIPLQPGEYKLRVRTPGLLSQTYQLSLLAGRDHKQTLNPTDQLLAPSKTGFFRTQLVKGTEHAWGVSIDAHHLVIESLAGEEPKQASIPWTAFTNGDSAPSFHWESAHQFHRNIVQGAKSSTAPFLIGLPGATIGLESDHLLIATRHQAFVAMVGCDGTTKWARGLAADVLQTDSIQEQLDACKQSPRSTIVEPPRIVADIDGDEHPDFIVHIASIPPRGLPQTHQAVREVIALSGLRGEILWSTTIPLSAFSLSPQEVPYHYKWFTGMNTGSSEGGSGTFLNQGYWSRNSNQSCELTGEFVAVGATIFLNDSRAAENPSTTFWYQVGENLLSIDLRTGRFQGDAIHLGGIPQTPPLFWPEKNDVPATLYWMDGGSTTDGQAAKPINVAPPSLRCVAWSLSENRVLWQRTLQAQLPLLRTWEMTLPRWPFLVDLDSDDVPEWIVPDESTNGIPGNPKSTAIRVLHAKDGEEKWHARIRHADMQIDHWVVGPDRDGDGVLDLIVTTMAGMPVRVHLDVLSGATGKTILQGQSRVLHRDSPETFYLCQPFLWENRVDGWPRVVVPLQSSHSREGDAAELKIFSIGTGHCEQEATQVHSVEIGDLDGDKVPDLSLSRFRTPELGLRGQSETHFVRGTGESLWDRMGQPHQKVSDLNGDGILDLIQTDYRSITAHNTLDGSLLWQIQLSGRASHTTVHSEQGVAPLRLRGAPSWEAEGFAEFDHRNWDFDDDGIGDLILESQTGGSKLEVLEAISGKTGSRIWKTRATKTYQQGSGYLQCQDLDRDGRSEIVYLSYSDSLLALKNRRSWSGDDGNLIVSVWDATTGAERWHRALTRKYGSNSGQRLPYPFASRPMPKLGMGDFNGDGVTDILAPAEPSAETTPPMAATWLALDGRDGTELWNRPGASCRESSNCFAEAAQARVQPQGANADAALSQVYFVEVRDDSREDGSLSRQLHAVAVAAKSGVELWDHPIEVDASFRRNFASTGDRLFSGTLLDADGKSMLLLGYEQDRKDHIQILDEDGTSIAKRSYPQPSTYPKPPIIWRLLDNDADGILDRAIVGSRIEIVDLSKNLETLFTIADAHAGTSVGMNGALDADRYPANVEVHSLSASHPPSIVLHSWGEHPSVSAFDSETGDRHWWSHGPTRHRTYSNEIVPTLAIPRRDGELPIVVTNHLDQSNARAACSDTPSSRNIQSPISLVSTERDVRFQRPLPWMQNSMATELPMEVVAFLVTGLFQSVLLVWIPGLYLWTTFRKRKWGLRWLLLLPILVAISLITLRVQQGTEGGGWFTSYGLALLFSPIVGMIGLIVHRCVQKQWRGVFAIFFYIVLGAILTAGGILSLHGWSQPLEPGEYYDWAGWYWIIPQSVFVTAYVYWAVRALGKMFHRQGLERRTVASAR